MTRLLSWPAVVGALAVVAVVGAGTAVALHSSRPAAQTAPLPPPPSPVAPSASPVPAPVIRLAVDTRGRLPIDAPLRLTISRAQLRSVTAVDDAGVAVPGGAQGLGWTGSSSLVPGARYTVTATVADAVGQESTRTLTAQAAPPKAQLTAVLSPGDDDTVGVGQPVIVRLSRVVPVAQRGPVAARLSVSSTPQQEGAWRWTSASELHWRPKVFWQAGTQVRVASRLDRLDLGGGTWGVGAHTSAFAIGAAHITTADVAAHTLTVRSGGKVVRLLKMSAGQPAYPTRSGIHLALEKNPSLLFDSSTVGIPTGSSGAYKETVAWDVRLTYSGTFVHAAPWSAKAQGRSNVSHGCLNLSTADARWFYEFTRRGDVVDIQRSGVPPLPQDPGSIDWNTSFDAGRNP